MAKTFFKLIGVLTLIFLLFILLAPSYLVPLSETIWVKIIRLILIGWVAGLITDVFYSSVFKNKNVNELAKNISLSFFILIILILVVETAFMFIPVSHSTSNTLAGQNWFYYYWKKNSMGFRDTELSEKDLTRKKILFLGDSFTAGHGIKKRSERFSDIAGEKLKPDFEFFNIGRNGADPDDEYNILVNFPAKPDVLVLQYFFNDIENATRRAGKFKEFPLLYNDIPLWQRPLVRGSFLLNFIYWKFPHNAEYNYLVELKKAYADSSVMADHLLSLKKFTDYCKANNTKLIVVLMPFLQDLKTSNELAIPVKKFFNDAGANVIDVSNLVANSDVKDRLVNINDFHASKMVNKIVADAIIKTISQ